MRIIKDIPYGPHPQNLLDLYLPDSDKYDLVLYMRGGYLERGSKDNNTHIFTYLAQQGIASATIDYRMYPTAHYPDFVWDAAAAAAWLKMNQDLLEGCQRIFISGSSAGAYLSLMLCFDSRYLGELGLKNTDFAGFFHDAGQPTCHTSVLKKLGLDGRRLIVDEHAPLYHVGLQEEYPPMHFVVSDDDIPGRYEQTMLMLSTLRHFGHHATVEVRQGGHCHYVGATDEGGSVLGQMIEAFVKSV